ncbi:unnamed protein product [Prorocentrum cordatum]|uniref:XK-related protein n=1 Tax=Prorocentrum cordatum TaxID=2364126 RepID=A0ABN9SAH4_9DINO|nr:unnamed protein product [Polarella glacialis]
MADGDTGAIDPGTVDLRWHVLIDLVDFATSVTYTIFYAQCVGAHKKNTFWIVNSAICAIELLVLVCSYYHSKRRAEEKFDVKGAESRLRTEHDNIEYMEGRAGPWTDEEHKRFCTLQVRLKEKEKKAKAHRVFFYIGLTTVWDIANSAAVFLMNDAMFAVESCGSASTYLKYANGLVSLLNMVIKVVDVCKVWRSAGDEDDM